jgi:dipeptidyl aminopeptidase/acylaminoacyl peptidase
MAQGRALTVDQFITLDRVAEPALSPDAKWVAYTVTTTDLAANRRRQDLWLVSAVGGAPRRLSVDSVGGRSAKWSPDGKTIAFISTRGTPQVWIYLLASATANRVTSLSTGADGVIWSPTGSMLAFASEVYPSCADDACNKARAAADEAKPSKAQTYDEPLFRHWTTWEDGLRSHIFVVPAAGGVPRDLLAGKDYDAPVPPFGGSGDYAFSPDGKELAFTTKVGNDQAWRTNTDIYTVATTGGEPVNVTAAMLGAESAPAYSPDGKYLAFLSQERANFESDRQRLMVRDRASAQVREVPKAFDRSINEYMWTPGGGDFVATAEDHQRDELLHITAAGDVHHILPEGNIGQVSAALDGQALTVAFVQDAADRPGNVSVWRLGSNPRVQVTHQNDTKLAGVKMNAAEEFSWIGAGGDTVSGLLIKPPQFQAGRRYPVVILIHGGPQGAWLDSFHSRWNAQLFAAPGYVVAMLNPRGSTGFGQKFVDQISRDWGGKVYTDIMTGVDYVSKLPYVDSTKMGAAGGSYGGYMVDWINGHTNRFKALISHAGVYNLESEYDGTEELWFPEWEFGGAYWASRADYEQWSPHRFAQNFKTPTLVIHGALDFRVPETQGMGMFQALRRQGVPARFVHFPDEGHWVGKPANQRVWWNAVGDWFGRYLGTPTP